MGGDLGLSLQKQGTKCMTRNCSSRNWTKNTRISSKLHQWATVTLTEAPPATFLSHKISSSSCKINCFSNYRCLSWRTATSGLSLRSQSKTISRAVTTGSKDIRTDLLPSPAAARNKTTSDNFLPASKHLPTDWWGKRRATMKAIWQKKSKAAWR